MMHLSSFALLSLAIPALADYAGSANYGYTFASDTETQSDYPIGLSSVVASTYRPKACRPYRPSSTSSGQPTSASYGTATTLSTVSPSDSSSVTSDSSSSSTSESQSTSSSASEDSTTSSTTSDVTSSSSSTTDTTTTTSITSSVTDSSSTESTTTSTTTTSESTTPSTTTTTTTSESTTPSTTTTTTTTTTTSESSTTSTPSSTPGPCPNGADFSRTMTDYTGNLYGVCDDAMATGTIILSVGGEVQEESSCADICSEYPDCIGVNGQILHCDLFSSVTGTEYSIFNYYYVKLSPTGTSTTSAPTSTPTGTGPCANGAEFASTFQDDSGDFDWGVCYDTIFHGGNLQPVGDDFVDRYECATVCDEYRSCIGATYYHGICYLKQQLNPPTYYSGIESIVKLT